MLLFDSFREMIQCMEDRTWWFSAKNKNAFVSRLAQGEAPEIANLTYNLVVVNSDS